MQLWWQQFLLIFLRTNVIVCTKTSLISYGRRLKTDDSITTDAVARYDGTVTWIRPVVYTIASRHEFRGNSWSVKLKYASWTYDASLLDLQPLPLPLTFDG